MFDFARTEIMQQRSPLFVFFEIFGDMLGKEDVPCVATIHHPLRHVDTRSGHVRPRVHIHHAADRPTVNAHAHLQPLVVFKRATNLKRTLRRLLWTLVKDQCHAVAGRDL